jgi:hypothetical protein
MPRPTFDRRNLVIQNNQVFQRNTNGLLSPLADGEYALPMGGSFRIQRGTVATFQPPGGSLAAATNSRVPDHVSARPGLALTFGDLLGPNVEIAPYPGRNKRRVEDGYLVFRTSYVAPPQEAEFRLGADWISFPLRVVSLFNHSPYRYLWIDFADQDEVDGFDRWLAVGMTLLYPAPRPIARVLVGVRDPSAVERGEERREQRRRERESEETSQSAVELLRDYLNRQGSS